MAVRDFTTAISIDCGNDVAYRGRGLAFATIGNYEQEIIEQDEAILPDPLNMGAHLGSDPSQILKATYDCAIAEILKMRPGGTAPRTKETA